jgi:hypothetical protein
MLTFTLRHELQLSPARFWTLFFDKEFNAKLYGSLGFPEWRVLEEHGDAAGVRRQVRAIPKMDVPGPVAKVLGSRFAYVEDGRFVRATQTYSVAMKPSGLEGWLRNDAVVRCEPLGEDRCTRVVEVTAEAKVFGLGGLIETAIEKNNRAMWAESVGFYNRWVKEHPAVAH